MTPMSKGDLHVIAADWDVKRLREQGFTEDKPKARKAAPRRRTPKTTKE